MTDRKPAIDLNHVAWHRTVGEYTIAGTWLRHDDGESEPCLVIHPSHAFIGKPAVIPLSAAYRYADPMAAAQSIRAFAQGMGKDSLQQAFKLADLINDHLSDLISLPPDRRAREVVADATVRIGDGPARSVELLE